LNAVADATLDVAATVADLAATTAAGLSSFYCSVAAAALAAVQTTAVNTAFFAGGFPPAILPSVRFTVTPIFHKERDIIEPGIHMTELDRETYDSAAQILKAAVAYAQPSAGKLLAVCAKFLELKKTLDYFSQPDKNLSICALSGNRPSPEEMLSDLKKYSDKNQAEMIDKMLNILHMTQFLEKYRELEKSPEFNTMMHMMKSMGNMNPSGRESTYTPPPAAYTSSGSGTFNQSSGQQDTFQMPDAATLSTLMNQMKQPGGAEQLKNMLTPQQRQLYETLSAMNQPSASDEK